MWDILENLKYVYYTVMYNPYIVNVCVLFINVGTFYKITFKNLISYICITFII